MEMEGVPKLLQGFERLAASFQELNFDEQVGFMKTMDKDLRKRVEDTRRKIDNMELDPNPLVRTCSLNTSSRTLISCL